VSFEWLGLTAPRKKGRRANRKIENARAHSLPPLTPYSHAKNRPSNREGIIDKVDGVRMHVSLSEAVRRLS
jgi:hypothetical protein